MQPVQHIIVELLFFDTPMCVYDFSTWFLILTP